jgi:hypothetical protein
MSANLIKALARRMYFVPEGQHDRSQARSAWPGVWTFSRAWVRVIGRTGHESLAQGLPWEPHPNVRSPEGATGIRDIPWRLVSGRPFRALGIKPKTQGKTLG